MDCKKIIVAPMKTFQAYKQYDKMDCGPACIRMLAKHYVKAVNIETLRNASQISKDGVSLLGIAEAAEKIGYNTKGATLTYNDLVREANWLLSYTLQPLFSKKLKKRYQYPLGVKKYLLIPLLEYSKIQ